jgi:hypothetical protein
MEIAEERELKVRADSIVECFSLAMFSCTGVTR